jgi:hypothetical protein
MACSSSREALLRASMEPKCPARLRAVMLPTWRIPRANSSLSKFLVLLFLDFCFQGYGPISLPSPVAGVAIFIKVKLGIYQEYPVNNPSSMNLAIRLSPDH